MAAVLPTVSADDNQMDNDILPYYQRRHSETSCPSFGGVTIETNSSSPVPERSEVDLVRALERAVRIETEGGGSPLPTLMHSPFWQEFPDFAFDPTAPLQCEIHRLARQNRWNLATERRYQAKAVMAELSLHYYDSGNLEQWQRLCKEVGITSDFKSITQCKKVKTVLVKPLVFLPRGLTMHRHSNRST
jgi:hypothetical protein